MICHSLIKQNNGELSFYSEGVNKGSVFMFTMEMDQVTDDLQGAPPVIGRHESETLNEIQTKYIKTKHSERRVNRHVTQTQGSRPIHQYHLQEESRMTEHVEKITTLNGSFLVQENLSFHSFGLDATVR